MAVREEHPITAVIFHYIIWISMFILGFSGFYIRYPFFPNAMGIMRNLHNIFAYVIILAVVARIYWAFVGKTALKKGSRKVGPDYKNFWFERENRGLFWQMIKYYLFLRKTHPRTAKYDPIQKLTYDFWLLLIIAQALTGFALYWPTAPFFTSINAALGGLMGTRIIHYLITWLFVLTISIHIYLGLAEDFGAFLVMFFQKERPR
jgi:Ni/Fe-hydrogenase 1 B-type cytochrome subunit